MKRAGYIITLMIAFWMVAGGLFFAQSVQAKVVSGSCGGETKYHYDSKSKKLELYGRGVVSQTIRVDEQLSCKNRYFQVKKLVIRQGDYSNQRFFGSSICVRRRKRNIG